MKFNFKSLLSLMLAVVMVLCCVPMQAVAADSTSLPDAEVSVMDSITLEAGEYKVWNGSLSTGDVDRPLQSVLKFKANDTYEEALTGEYSDWVCDFYLTFEGMTGDSVSGNGSYLAGNYGTYGWIVIPTDGLTVEEGVEYPIVSNYDDKLTYANICDYVKEFTAALYVSPETLAANPNMTVTLELNMKNPETDEVITVGEPAVYTVPELYGKHLPEAEVTVLDPVTLEAGNYSVYDGSLKEGTVDLPLQAVMNFKAIDTLAEAQLGGYADWVCDFYLTFDGMVGDSISGVGSYLAGNYGNYGWIAIPTDSLTVEEGVEYPVVTSFDPKLTYENICDYVRDFTAALYINPETLIANPDMTVSLSLKIKNPENADDTVVIGEPEVYTAPELFGSKWPEAEVTVLDPVTLEAGNYSVYDGSLKEGTVDLPLQAVMNFKAIDTLEEAQLGGFGKWICDFYLEFEGMANGTITADNCYLAGNYGSYGWIAIPTDGLVINESERYPVVTNYDPNLTYENVCDYVRDFTAALYIAPEILAANPDLTVSLSLQMTNPEDPANIITIDEEAEYTAEELLSAIGYVAKNTTTNKLYTDVNLANDEALAGETVILLTDVEVRMLSVFETFDLNGYTLTAKYVTSYGDIIDSSASNSGYLKVDTKTFFAQDDNAQLAVNTPNGYQFVEMVGFNYTYVEADQKYVCQPLFEEYAHELLLAGQSVSGVSIQISVEWTNNEGEPRSQKFTYNSQAFLEGYINSYKPSNGKYGKMFTLKLNDVTEELTYKIQVVSDNGITLSSGATVVAEPEDTVTTENITISNNAGANQASAFVPEGTKLSNSSASSNLKLTVSELNNSESNITLNENEVQKSFDVHIEGISNENTVPTIITVAEFAEKGLNEGNLKLYHVEGGKTVAMSQVFTVAEVDAHNEFYYDPATGDVIMALATFSEITAVINTENAWKGEFDYTWYNSTATNFTIANADQLAAFGAIVGGMNGQTQDSFSGKTVKLLADINLGDKESENNPDLIFYPIGYNSSDNSYEKTNTAITSGFYSFDGTFDGNGHTISNFYQNTWEMKGDNNYYEATLQYYRDGMGLFGSVYGGTVKNLTVDNFSSDGEYTTTGVIAAYADCGATFENISITNCNPRVYNIGNGGIIGCAGWYSRSDENAKDNPVVFKNITVDQTNKISALWGSYDVSCGGILGQYYPDSGCGLSFENCHVAAIMDVNNDVCANYQYYWYRYSGMLIGTVRANTSEGGYTVADTSGITVTDCTYTLGDWNEYWYCELVKNSLASYTHDHQFSRLTKIASLSEIQDANGNWTKEGNFVIPAADNSSAECYHIFKNSNGELYQHFHDVADESNPNIYETFDLNGDGELNDLKEDRQCYFMPFNQVLSGLGYGVKPHYEFEGMTEVENGTVKSVEKFESKGEITTYRPGQTISLGSLVRSVVDESKLSKATLYAFVSPAEEEANVSATYSLNEGDWENSTITFAEDCVGSAIIIITDYFYCTPTVIILNEEGAAEKFTANTVEAQNAYTQITLGDLFGVIDGATIGNVTATVTDPNGNASTVTGTESDWSEKTIDLIKDGTWTVVIKDDDAYCAVTTATFTVNKVDKFTKNFNKDFLYRVGNANTVAISTIFGEIETAVDLSSVYVTIEKVAGDAAGTFTSNATCTKGTIQFTGTGVVEVTISADGANDLTINLEVVDATNITSESGWKDDTTSVLLNNIALTSEKRIIGKKTFYGNGFTVDASDAPYDGVQYDYAAYVIYLEDSTLDNVIIEGKVYPKIGGTKTDDYYRALVMSNGDCTISNCFLSNTFAPIRNGGNLNLKDTTLKGGVYANMDIRNGHVILDNVTTINQFGENIFSGDKEIVGLGIVVYQEGGTESLKITIKNNLTQFNLVSQAQTQDFDDYSQIFAEQVFENEAFTKYLYNDGTTKWANLGIISMNNYFSEDDLVDERENKQGYWGTKQEINILANSRNCFVYSNTPESASTPSNITFAGEQGIIVPDNSFDFTSKNYVAKTEGSNDYCVEDNGSVNISMDEGDTFSWDPMILAAKKNGSNLEYTVKMNGDDYTDKSISFDKTGTYTIVYSYTDAYNYRLNSDGILEAFEVMYTKELTVEVAVVKAKAKNAVFSFGANGTAYSSKTVLIGDKTYVMPDVTATVSGKIGSTTVNGTTVYYPITEMYTSDGKTAHTGSWYACFPIFKDALQIIDYADEGTGDAVTYNQTEVTKVAEIPATLKATNPTSAFLYQMNATNYPPPTDPTAVSGAVCYTCNRNGLTNGNTRKEMTIIAEYTYTDNAGKVYYYYIGYHCAEQTKGSCVTGDTLITLADGTQKRMDELSENDLVKVFDHETGTYSEVPLLYYVNDGVDEYSVINLQFSDGNTTRIIYEHALFDMTLNKYVYIREDNYTEFIGHKFAKDDGNGGFERITLDSAFITEETVGCYSITSMYHLNYYINGMLSLPGAIDGLFNYFDFDPETLQYDEEKMNEDIEKYGLYTYEDFAEDLTEEMFNTIVPAKYLKVAVGKGLITFEGILELFYLYLA